MRKLSLKELNRVTPEEFKKQTKTPFVLVKEFENIRLAQEYINSYKAGYEILDEYQDNKIYFYQ
mgnify:CR=1 FL=1